MPLIVHTIPAFTDNYIWLFHQQNNNEAYVVDPGDAVPVVNVLDRLGLSLKGILVTHHHPDHTGGINQLLELSSVPVYGPQGITQVSHIMQHGDTLDIAGETFEVLEIPGHTLDHIAYYSAREALVFCGDTLFANGCGRLFEGTPEQMWHSLSLLASLPAETKVYCAHEYTKANTDFALAVEPDNDALCQRAKEVDNLRVQNLPTVPSTIGVELATNPFIRAGEASVQRAASEYGQRQVTQPGEAFALIRRWKDGF